MISDNDLLLYYYRDGLDAAQRARIAGALSEQPELAARLHRLVARLDAAAASPDVPVPEQVQRRWEAALERAAVADAAPERRQPRSAFGPVWRMAAAACVLAVCVVSMRIALRPAAQQVAEQEVSQAAQPGESSVPAESPAYERRLRLHLVSTASQLQDLGQASDEERSRLIEAIIAQNRLYAIAAERADEPRLARVLRSFTPILEHLAAEGGESPGEVAQLEFELKVLEARLNAAATDRSGADSVAL